MVFHSIKSVQNSAGDIISSVAGAIGGGYLGCKLGAKHGSLGKLAGSVIGIWGGKKIAADVSRAIQHSAQALNWVYMTVKQ